MPDSAKQSLRRCGVCRRAEMKLICLPEYSMAYADDDSIHSIHVANFRVWQCTNPDCASIRIDNEGSQTLDNACRDQLLLLQPESIREQREKLGLTRTALAQALRIDEEALARYETGGQIQPGSVDKLLRLFFALPEVRREVGAEPNRVRGEAGLHQETTPV